MFNKWKLNECFPDACRFPLQENISFLENTCRIQEGKCPTSVFVRHVIDLIHGTRVLGTTDNLRPATFELDLKIAGICLFSVISETRLGA